MTFMGLTYWLIPKLSGRKLWSPNFAVAQSWVYFVGVMIFARGMHWAGTLGYPRRVPLAQASYWLESWNVPAILTAVGGSIMYVGVLMYFAVLVMSLVRKPATEDLPQPVYAEAISPASSSPAIFENWRVWVAAAIGVILVAYGPFLLTYTYHFVSRGYGRGIIGNW